MEKKGKTVIVMTPDGSFREIKRKNRNYRIGEEIFFSSAQDAKSGKLSPFSIASSLAAAILFCFILFNGMPNVVADKQVVAYVSMDINPSLEIGVDKKEIVRELNGLNDDGRELIDGLSYEGKDLTEVTEAILDKAEPNYLQNGEADIVISAVPAKDGASVDDERLAGEVERRVKEHLLESHPNETEQYRVTALPAVPEVRAVAKENGLSVGKYVAYLQAKQNGIDVTVEDFKNGSIHTVAKELGGVGQLIGQGTITKEIVRKLWEDEKSGELDRKLKELLGDEYRNDKDKEDRTAAPKTPKPAKTPGKPRVKPANTPTPSLSAPSATPGTPDPSGNGKDEDGNKDDKGNGKGNGKGAGNGRGEEDDDKDNGNGRDKGDASHPGGSTHTPDATASAEPGQTPSVSGEDSGKDSDDGKDAKKGKETEDSKKRTSFLQHIFGW